MESWPEQDREENEELARLEYKHALRRLAARLSQSSRFRRGAGLHAGLHASQMRTRLADYITHYPLITLTLLILEGCKVTPVRLLH